jgi:hypothetical protein
LKGENVGHIRKNVLLGQNDAPILTNPKEIEELLKKVAWPSHEPIQFLRRRGTSTPADEEHYVKFHTPQSMEAMWKLGIRLPKRFHLFKGFGMKHERGETEKTIECAKWLHAHGMKITIYVGGTMFSDSFFMEVPEAVNWMRRDQEGQPVTYAGYQLWRYFPCLNNPGYLEYTKRVLDVAVDVVEADEIFFDNQILRHEPRSCRCEHCVKHFRDYVAKTYSPEELERRYGFPEVGLLRPPIWSQANQAMIYDEIKQPDIQDWVLHRTHTVMEFYKTMADHVHAKRPETVVGMNIKGIYAHNTSYDNGIDHNLLASKGKLQFSCLDSGQADPRMDGKARVTELRTFKASNTLKMPYEAGGDDLATAEAQVFGYRPFYKGYGWFGAMDREGIFTPLAQFFRKNEAMFREKKHVYEVGVLRTSVSMNYSNRAVPEVVYPVEETLFAAKLPVGLVFDMNINELGGYKVIVAAEQRGLSDEWITVLLKFVKNGGGVVFTGGTGMYDGWYRPRTGGKPSHGLEPFFGEVPKKPLKKELGKGRVAYLPQLALPYKMDRGDWPEIPYDKMVPLEDEKPLLDAVRYAAGGPFIAEAKGPASVTMEVTEGEKKGSLLLHFVNYDPKKKGKLAVKMHLPASKKSVQAMLVIPAEDGAKSYEPPAPKKLAAKMKNGVLELSLPVPKVYAGVAIE